MEAKKRNLLSPSPLGRPDTQVSGYAMYIAVHIRFTVSSINPVAFSKKRLQLIDPEIQQASERHRVSLYL